VCLNVSAKRARNRVNSGVTAMRADSQRETLHVQRTTACGTLTALRAVVPTVRQERSSAQAKREANRADARAGGAAT
jgi:hypothetical protein